MSERKIAFFVDLDNVDVTLQNFTEMLEKLQALGEIVYCKVYNFNLKRHADIGELVAKYGFLSAALVKENKKRKFDVRIAIDALKLAYTNEYVNTYALVAHNNGVPQLSGALKELGGQVIEIYGDRITNEMANEHIRLVSYFVQDNEGSQTTQKLFMISKMTKFAKEIGALARSNDKEERARLLRDIELFIDRNADATEILESKEELELFNRIKSSLEMLRD